MNQNDSLSYDVTSLFMAVKKTKDLELAVNDLLTTLSKINLDGLELKTASNLDNTITEINSVKSVELSELSGNLEKTKILAEQGDENINTLFSTMDNLTSGEITAEEAIVEIMNNQNLTFEAVKMYDEVLNEYTKELTGIKNQIDELTMENSGYVVDELSAALWEEDVNKKTESLNKKYNDLAAATSILKQLRDYLYQEAAMAYMEYPDFDEVSSGRIASYTTDFVETAVGLYEESYGYYKYNFYDENGNKIDDVSYLEQAIYFNSNNIAIAQTDDKNRILEDLDYIKYLNEDERKVLLYLERTNNENYNEFYTFEKGIANQRHGEELANEFINELENNNSNDLQLFGSLIEEGLSDGVDNFFGGLNNLFSADGIVSPEQYKSMYILNYVNEKYEEETILKYIQTGTYEISNSIGNMLPSVFVGTITANPLLGATTMGLSAAGNAREQGLQMGMTDVQSWFYGAMTGLSEAGLQYLLGGIPGLSNLEKIGGGTGFKAFLSRMASEGIEESTQALLDPLFLTITTGKPYEVDMNEVLKSGIYGVITAGLMNGGQLVLNGAVCKVDSLSQGKISELISKFQGKDLTDPKIQQELAEELSNNNEEIVEEEMAESELDEILSEDEIFESELDEIISEDEVLDDLVEQSDENNVPNIIDNRRSLFTRMFEAFDSAKYDFKVKQLAKEIRKGTYTDDEVLKMMNERTINSIVVDGKTYYSQQLSSIIDKCKTGLVDFSTLDSIQLNKSDVNSAFQTESYSVQKNLVDSLYSCMIDGNNVNSKTSNAILKSNLFARGDSMFSRIYLYDKVEEIFGTEMAEKVSKTYVDARKSTTVNEMATLYSYCDHTESHVMQVAFGSLQALNEIKKAGLIDYSSTIDGKTIFVAGLLHDLGMASATTDLNDGSASYANISTSLDENGRPSSKTIEYSDYNKNEFKFSSDIRKNHSFNSPLEVLKNRSYFDGTGINPDVVALLCFSHSKSNSGVGSLIEVSDWSLSISRIIDGVNTYNEEHPNNKIVFNPNESIGKFTDEIGQTTPQKISNKENKRVEVPIFNFKDNLLNELSSGAWAIRVGDAYVNKAKIVLPSDKAVKWFYKGKEYSATTFVLTQSGLYMAYDSTKSQLYDFAIAKSINNSDTEVSDRGAFAYFKYDDGEFIPVSSNIKDSNTGVYILNESDLMSAMGDAKVEIMDNKGKKQEYLVTEKGFLVRKNDIIRSPFNKEHFYALHTYKPTYDSNGKIISLSETMEEHGDLIITTTGQFLTGESNIEYDFYYDESRDKFISDYYISDIDSYLHNTISKGCHERVGEIAGAKNASRGVNIVLTEEQFIESFDVDNGQLIPKTDTALVLYREILNEASSHVDTENNINSISFYINGYLLCVE